VHNNNTDSFAPSANGETGWGGDAALGCMAHEALQKYFQTLNGHKPEELYDLVIGEVEKPLFRAVLDYTGGNQSLAAAILGINRGTLRKKLRRHGLLV
jgi:Fis family transcriptional regulator, factor for inversion stimulation protein